jgi:hypothetical protein
MPKRKRSAPPPPQENPRSRLIDLTIRFGEEERVAAERIEEERARGFQHLGRGYEGGFVTRPANQFGQR